MLSLFYTSLFIAPWASLLVLQLGIRANRRFFTPFAALVNDLVFDKYKEVFGKEKIDAASRNVHKTYGSAYTTAKKVYECTLYSGSNII